VETYDQIKNLHRERGAYTRRVLVAGGITLLLVVALIARLLDLQVLEHGYYSTRSDDNRMRLVAVPPVRGLIYDRNGALLAQNLPSFDLVITPEQVHDLRRTIARLRKILPITQGDVERFHQRMRELPRFRQIPLRTNLSAAAVARFEVDRYKFPGVDINASLVRSYPLGADASHVIGYVGGITEADLKRINPDLYAGLSQIGRAGVEASHENQLRGTPGAKMVETNAAGRPLRELNYQPSKPGDNLYLTIDARLQEVASKALGQLDGAVVAIDPRNGEVLAMVSKPGYDPALFVQGISNKDYHHLLADPDKPLYDRAMQGTYAPGSTIKPFMAYSALEENVLTPQTRIWCPGYFTLPGSSHRYRCWKRSGHGWMTLESAIQQSCDVFFYNVANDLGINRIDAMLSQFGFGKPTGIDLPHERAGLLPSPAWKRRALHQPWYPGETLITGIGQGYLTVTPLELASALARLSMHGRGFVPHIVHAVGDPLDGRVTIVQPQPLPDIPARNPDIWTDIIKGMELVTQTIHGTAYNIGHDSPYPIAAKTGSAQVISMAQNAGPQHNQTGVPYRLRDNALFVAFAPAEDPKIAVAVVAEHGVHGGSAAAPVARKVMDMYLLGKVEYDSPPPTREEAGAIPSAPVTPAPKPAARPESNR
jgi:penicillin-binding protein 2